MNSVFPGNVAYHQAEIIPQHSPWGWKPPASRGFAIAASSRQDHAGAVDLDEGAVNGKPACEQSIDIYRKQRPPHLVDLPWPIGGVIYFADDIPNRRMLEKNQVVKLPDIPFLCRMTPG
jgi:hypothetical protein